MKRILAIVLVLAMAFSLAACGKKGDDTPSNDTPENSAPANSDSSNTVSTAPPIEDVAPEASNGVQMEIVHGVFGDFARYTTPHTQDMKIVDPTTLNVGQAQVIESGNPQKGSGSCFYDLVFDRLIEYDLDTGKLTGDAFKEWSFSEDNTTLTFTMYDNIVFHNGTPATAEDVFYTLQRCTDSTLSQLADKSVFGNIDFDKSEITGTYSGKIVLKTPTVTFIPGLTSCWLLCKSYIEEKGEDDAWWSNTVGSGAYKVDSIIQGDRYNLSRNDNYWGEKGPFEKVVIRTYTDQATMYMDFETHNVDMIVGVSSNDVELAVNGGLENSIVELIPMLNTYDLVVNEEKGNPALADENVRKAIALAIDRETVQQLAWGYLVTTAISSIPAGLPDAIDVSYEQDIEGAKAALKAAGYKPGELTLVLGTSNASAQLRAAEVMQEMLMEVGFNVDMITCDAVANIMNMRNVGTDTYDISMTSLRFEALESANLLGSVVQACGASGMSGCTDPKVDEIALRAKAATTVAEKQECMKELQRYMQEHYWIVPLVEYSSTIVYRDYISGIRCLIPRMADLSQVKVVG